MAIRDKALATKRISDRPVDTMSPRRVDNQPGARILIFPARGHRKFITAFDSPAKGCQRAFSTWHLGRDGTGQARRSTDRARQLEALDAGEPLGKTDTRESNYDT
jgi:hypothetical protein